ncbi:MAG TPA: biopolymer transporter ExbD [Steroidobacteraceae bacterium]|jgi:biopolymer transport protein ExbD|nr:biopolymer transporter ExbD [Steroidobacteraceae bacterium]
MIPFLPSRLVRGSPRHRTEVELNLIPLIDILSVMVAFLLVYTTNVEVVQNAKGVEIPQSTADVQPQQAVVVMITKDQLFVQNELITTIAEIRESPTPLIEPLRAVLERPLLVNGAPAAQAEALAAREITVLADKSLPYEVVKKVMQTCTAASYGKISLAVIEKEKLIDAIGKTA